MNRLGVTPRRGLDGGAGVVRTLSALWRPGARGRGVSLLRFPAPGLVEPWSVGGFTHF